MKNESIYLIKKESTPMTVGILSKQSTIIIISYNLFFTKQYPVFLVRYLKKAFILTALSFNDILIYINMKDIQLVGRIIVTVINNGFESHLLRY